jgi:hypothetical protein
MQQSALKTERISRDQHALWVINFFIDHVGTQVNSLVLAVRQTQFLYLSVSGVYGTVRETQNRTLSYQR